MIGRLNCNKYQQSSKSMLITIYVSLRHYKSWRKSVEARREANSVNGAFSQYELIEASVANGPENVTTFKDSIDE